MPETGQSGQWFEVQASNRSAALLYRPCGGAYRSNAVPGGFHLRDGLEEFFRQEQLQYQGQFLILPSTCFPQE